MGSRSLCPSCNSSTALGSIVCFKCGYKTQGGDRTSLWVHNKPKLATIDVEIPFDVVFNSKEFHADALKWLYSNHVFDLYIHFNNIGYIPSCHKVFLPAINQENELMFYQLRGLKDGDIKYMTYGKASNYIIHYHGHNNTTVVIVEDYLSAIRVRKQYNVVALSGTSIKSSAIEQLIKRYNKFIIWLDADSAGINARHKLLKTLAKVVDNYYVRTLYVNEEATKYNAVYVQTSVFNKDPKKYTDSDIKHILTYNTTGNML